MSYHVILEILSGLAGAACGYYVAMKLRRYR